MAIQIDGRRIDNKTNVQTLPHLSKALKQRLLNEDLPSFGILRKHYRRRGRAAFSQLLRQLGASGREIGFLISICRQRQNLPPRPSQSPQPSV